jgi:hypothetical protein
MDSSYQSAMIQALLGQQYAAPGTTGQLAGSPYGQSFITGNQYNSPANMIGSTNGFGNGSAMQSGQGSMTNSPSTMLSQPTSTMSY